MQVEQDEEAASTFDVLKKKDKMVVCRLCKGDHWTLKCPYKDTLGAIADLANISTYLEPAVAACAPPNEGQMVMLLRTNIQQLWAARSTDGGSSWSVAYRTPLPNPDSKVNLFSWRGAGAGGGAPADGDLVLTLNPVANCTTPYCPRAPLAIAVSRDCGGSWGPLFNVELAGGGEGSFGYPTAMQCADAGGAPAVCLTYSVGAQGGQGGIRFSVVPAALLA